MQFFWQCYSGLQFFHVDVPIGIETQRFNCRNISVMNILTLLNLNKNSSICTGNPKNFLGKLLGNFLQNIMQLDSFLGRRLMSLQNFLLLIFRRMMLLMLLDGMNYLNHIMNYMKFWQLSGSLLNGVPLRFCSCASCFGILIIVDGNELFKSFYGKVKLKIVGNMP